MKQQARRRSPAFFRIRRWIREGHLADRMDLLGGALVVAGLFAASLLPMFAP